jgi:hypothetical protein
MLTILPHDYENKFCSAPSPLPIGIYEFHHESVTVFYTLRSPEIDSASLCRLAGRYDNPIPVRFLASIDCSKIPALGSTLCKDSGTRIILLKFL